MIDFLNSFGSSISRNEIHTITKKWKDESATQDLRFTDRFDPTAIKSYRSSVP